MYPTSVLDARDEAQFDLHLIRRHRRVVPAIVGELVLIAIWITVGGVSGIRML